MNVIASDNKAVFIWQQYTQAKHLTMCFKLWLNRCSVQNKTKTTLFDTFWLWNIKNYFMLLLYIYVSMYVCVKRKRQKKLFFKT